jgi:peptidoglycan/LPS O-acetylase OafA/YrhL
MRRMSELDAVRGMAALSIVIYHLWFPKWFHGWTRVDLFFVLSGYLLTERWLRKSGSPGFFRELILRRSLRICPAYLAALAGLLACRALAANRFPLDGLPYYLTFTQNCHAWWNGAVPPFSPRFFHTWSLALDVQFYVLWLVLLVCGGRRLLIPAAISLVAIAVVGRSLGVSEHILPGRCDGFGAGAILAAILSDAERVARHARRVRSGLLALVACGLAFIAVGMAGEWETLAERAVPWPGMSILAVVMVSVGLLGLLVGAQGGPATRWLRCRTWGYLGTISYGIYLYHLPVFAVVEHASRVLGFDRSWLIQLVQIAASLLVAAMSWEFLERPILGLRDRFITVPRRRELGFSA